MGGGQNSSNELSDLIGSDIPDAPTGVIPDEYFRLSQDGTYYIVGDNANSCELLYHISGDIVIPSEFNGLPVKEIGLGAFDLSAITSVVVPDSITTIDTSAFYNCKSLTSINIPNSVTTIGYSAFSGCSSLTSITIGNSVTTIGYNAFNNCSSLTSITVDPNNTVYKSDGNCLIEKATNKLIAGFKNSIIPNYVTIIGIYAFQGCTLLTSIEIPDSVTEIDSCAFHYCSSLKNVIIKGKPTVNSNAFNQHHSQKLKKIYVIDGQGYVSTDTFSGIPIKILPSTPAVVVKEIEIETMIIE